MKQYHATLKKNYPPNYFFGLKTFEKRLYTREEETEDISLMDLINKNYDKDVIKLIYKYYLEMKPIMTGNYTRKMRNEFKYNSKHIIYSQLTLFPEGVRDFNWDTFFIELIIKFQEKYNNHLINKNQILLMLTGLAHDICTEHLKAIFVSIVGKKNLIKNEKCNCCYNLYNHYLKQIDKPRIYYLEETSSNPNYFDEFFYKNGLNPLYNTIRKLFNVLIKIEMKLKDVKYTRIKENYGFPDSGLYKKLVTKY